MKIVIIGWYGTETIGDRAILAGLSKVLSKITHNLEIYLGSIYPFFTERTLYEDITFINEMSQDRMSIHLFDSRDHRELKKYIKLSDCVFVGGGPLMDVSWMYMIEYAIMKAKKAGKKTGLLGCGIGPLYQKQYINACRNILKKSDILIFRDNDTLKLAGQLCPEKKEYMHSIIDPASFCALHFKMMNSYNKKDYIAINIREFPAEYLEKKDNGKLKKISSNLNTICRNMIHMDKKIVLVPMHYFAIGGDDRVILNEIKNQWDSKNIIVCNNPLSLEETLEVFSEAKYCIGMRFHSVVFQTIVNGNNYIIDYTTPGKGKILGFIKSIDELKFYKNRYINLQNMDNNIQFQSVSLNINPQRLIDMEKEYIRLITESIK